MMPFRGNDYSVMARGHTWAYSMGNDKRKTKSEERMMCERPP